MERIAVNGGQVDGLAVGEGPTVLLVHGSLGATPWEGLLQQPKLRDHFRLITWHRRGYLGSDRAPVGFSLADQAADATAVLEHFGVPQAHVVGHSFGGRIAIQLVQDRPELVCSLALLETGGPPVASLGAFVAVIEAVAARHREGDDAGAVDMFMRYIGGDGYRTALDAVLPAGWFEQTIADVDTFFDVELPARSPFGPEHAAAIHQPVLAVVGERSPLFFQDGFTWLCEHLPKVESFRLAGATHLLPMEEPSTLAAALAGFIGRYEGS